MSRVATIILNRNLPEVTDKLHDSLLEKNNAISDMYIVEAGSDSDNLSKNTTWYNDSPDVMKNGLRYNRGMNYGLCKLIEENKFKTYDAFFFLTNDIEFEEASIIEKLMQIMDEHPRLGILSPCSKRWGERLLLEDQKTKYFWFIHPNAFLMRREFIEDICNVSEKNYMNFLFDGSNFRGYLSEVEIIAKGYANNWAAGITTEVWSNENESYLLNKSDLIKTEKYEDNLKLYLEEGKKWIRNKYGFNSHWSMQQYSKDFYDSFFKFNPQYNKYKV